MRDAEVVVRMTDDDGVVHVMYAQMEFPEGWHGVFFRNKPRYAAPQSPTATPTIVENYMVDIQLEGHSKPFNDEGHFMAIWQDDVT